MGVITRKKTIEEVDLWNFILEYYECSKCGEQIQKHIIQEGARYHVISGDSQGTHCSENDCERNHSCG